ncbi:MAG: hypothetical protein AAGA90_12885 [Actinomycetota bacterium]
MLPGFLVVVFWIWFAVGALILIHRLVTTGSFRSGAGGRGEEVSESERRATAERHAAFEAQLAAFAPEKASTVPAHQVMASTPATGDGAPEHDIPAARPATPSNPDGLLPAAARAKTLAEALEGIHMPGDLVPVPDERPDPRHMLFATTTTPADAVGTALADELERLGFDLIPMDERSIAAVKPEARIEVRILPDEAAGTPGPLFGRVAPGSTVTEFRLS